MDLNAEVAMVPDANVPLVPPNNFRNTRLDSDMISNLGKYLSFEELKRLRLVCSSWNNAISTNPRLTDGKLKFDQESMTWLHFIQGNPVTTTMPRWYSAKLERVALKNSRFMKRVWNPRFRDSMRKLEISKVLTDCLQLTKFINTLPCLEELTLDQVRFKKFQRFVVAAGVSAAVNPEDHQSYCDHLGLPNNMTAPINPVERTIRKIKLIKLRLIPICLLELLRQRCQTVLQEFEFSGSRTGVVPREALTPSLQLQETHLRQLISENFRTLSKFTWKDHGRGNGFVRTLNFGGHPELVLLELALETPKNPSLDPAVEAGPIFTALLREFPRTQPGLTKLELNLNSCRQGDQIAFMHCVQAMQGLNSLILRFSHFLGTETLNLDFRKFRRLQSLQVTQLHNDTSIFKLACLANNWLPNALRELAIDTRQSMSMETLTALIAPRTHAGLTKLMIGKLNATDDAIQLLIQELPLLEDLSLMDAPNVTDFGLTGLPLEAVNMILKAQSYRLLFGQGNYIQKEGTRNLSELRCMNY